MFDDKCTVLPIWVRNRLFNVTERFPHRSKKHPESETSIVITHPGGKKTKHLAHVTTLPRPKLGPVMRLQFGNDVKKWLSKAFNKTFHRNEERKANGLNGPTIERLVPFWEIIDIEWDCVAEEFHFRAWYSLESNDEKLETASLDLSPNEVKQQIKSFNLEDLQKVAIQNDVSIWKLKQNKTPSKTPVRKTVLKRRLTMAGIDWTAQNSLKNPDSISDISAWLVLQNPESIYADVEGECYEYPRSIPNGTRIDGGDYLICSLASKKSKNGKRIFGIGRISSVEEFLKDGRKMRKAYYEWYREFPEPKTFDFIGGDPRVNVQHSMNPIPLDRVNNVVNLLVGEFSGDHQVMEKEVKYHSNSTSNSTPQNKFPDWLSQALNNSDN